MKFSEATSWKDRLIQLDQVKCKCNSIITSVRRPKDDARIVGMVHVRQFCNTLAAVPMKLQQNAEKAKLQPAICSLLGLDDQSALSRCLGDLNKNSKASFVTMSQFALENCIYAILSSHPDGKPKQTFSDNAKQLLKIAAIGDIDWSYDVLMVPARIRNSLHDGGIHRKSSATVVIDGTPYTFEKGKRVDCASWSHLLHSLYHCLDIYKTCFLSPGIAVIKYTPATA